MTPSEGDGMDAACVDYPRFEHGEDLLILVRDDGTIEFRLDSPGEYLRADCAVDVTDVV